MFVPHLLFFFSFFKGVGGFQYLEIPINWKVELKNILNNESPAFVCQYQFDFHQLELSLFDGYIYFLSH